MKISGIASALAYAGLSKPAGVSADGAGRSKKLLRGSPGRSSIAKRVEEMNQVAASSSEQALNNPLQYFTAVGDGGRCADNNDVAYNSRHAELGVGSADDCASRCFPNFSYNTMKKLVGFEYYSSSQVCFCILDYSNQGSIGESTEMDLNTARCYRFDLFDQQLNPGEKPNPFGGDDMLLPGEAIYSLNGLWRLKFTTPGNLVKQFGHEIPYFYWNGRTISMGTRTDWLDGGFASNTAASGGKAEMTQGGHLQVLDSRDSDSAVQVWQSAGSGRYFFLTNEGYMMFCNSWGECQREDL